MGGFFVFVIMILLGYITCLLLSAHEWFFSFVFGIATLALFLKFTSIVMAGMQKDIDASLASKKGLKQSSPKVEDRAGTAKQSSESGSITKDATPEAIEPSSITVLREEAMSGTDAEKEALIAINKLVEDLVKAMQIIGPKVEDLEAKLNLVMAKLEMK
jgi:hypothetical protein